MLEFEIIENQDGKFIVSRNDMLGQHLLRGHRWEEHFTQYAQAMLSPGDTAIDVGANLGYTTVVLGKILGDSGRVFSFEPLRITFQQLCGNVILNGLENVTTYNYVVGHENDVTVSMIPVDYHEECVNIMNACIGVGGDLVQMVTLDSFNFSDVALLKVDVQGCEQVVLQGARKMIERCRPLLFVEIEEPQLKNQGTNSEKLMMDIFSMSYVMFWNPDAGLHDWIAVPAEDKNLLEQTTKVLGPNFRSFACP